MKKWFSGRVFACGTAQKKIHDGTRTGRRLKGPEQAYRLCHHSHKDFCRQTYITTAQSLTSFPPSNRLPTAKVWSQLGPCLFSGGRRPVSNPPQRVLPTTPPPLRPCNAHSQCTKLSPASLQNTLSCPAGSSLACATPDSLHTVPGGRSTNPTQSKSDNRTNNMLPPPVLPPAPLATPRWTLIRLNVPRMIPTTSVVPASQVC